MLAAIPERIAGAIIIDPLGAHLDVLPEFAERLRAGLSEGERARVDEIEAKEDAGTATSEESLESVRLVWPSCFADPPSAPPFPEMEIAVGPFTATFASVGAEAEAGGSNAACLRCRRRSPCSFFHGAASPMPVRASTATAALISHARVEVVEGAGHFTWVERPDEVRDAVHGVVAAAVGQP